MDWQLIFMMVCLIILLAIAMIASISSDILRVLKWLGLGAIAGNVINNKINADASSKSGKLFKKKSFKTGVSLVDKAVEFVSPETDLEEVNVQLEADEYKEFQAFRKWKETQKQEVE